MQWDLSHLLCVRCIVCGCMFIVLCIVIYRENQIDIRCGRVTLENLPGGLPVDSSGWKTCVQYSAPATQADHHLYQPLNIRAESEIKIQKPKIFQTNHTHPPSQYVLVSGTDSQF